MYNDKVNTMLSTARKAFSAIFFESGIGGWSQKRVLKRVIK